MKTAKKSGYKVSLNRVLSTSSGNLFDQELNTTDTPAFQGLTLDSYNGVLYTSNGNVLAYDTLPVYAGPTSNPTFTDNGNGTATIGEFTAHIYPNSDFTGILKEYFIASQTISFIEGAEEYVVVDYNSGSPICRKETNKLLVNGSTIFTVFICWRQNNTIHSICNSDYGLGLASKTYRSIYNTTPYRRSIDGGLILSESSSPVYRTILVSSSIVYAGSIPVAVSSFNSSSTGNLLTEVTKIGGEWTYNTVSYYDNLKYSTETSTGLMNDNRWCNRFFYRSIGDVKEVFYTLGNQQYYNDSTACKELPPTPPLLLRDHCVYIGHSVIRKGSSTGEIHPAFDYIAEEPEYNFYVSSGIWESPTISTSTGIVTVGEGKYLLYKDSTYNSATLDKYTISGSTFSISEDGLSHYIVAKYNSGTPIIDNITNVNEINQSDVIPILTCYNLSGQILYIFWDQFSQGLSNKLCHRLVKTQRFQIQPGGLVLGEAATRYVTITGGNVWYGATYSELSAINSSIAGNEIAMWYHVGGVLTRFTATQYDNTYYDNGTDRIELNPNRYAVNWVYRGVSQLNNRPVILLGGGNYTLAEAIASTQPTDIPTVTSNFGVLVGRIIVLKGASSSTQIDAVQSTFLSSSPITNHNYLDGLQGGVSNEYYHLSSSEHTTATQASSSVQDGYLTSANFNTFNNKAEKSFAIAIAIALG